MHLKHLTTLLLILNLSACATPKKYEAKLNQEIGKTEQQLISVWGQPNQIKELQNGDKIITYTSINQQLIPEPALGNMEMMNEDEIFYPFTYGGNIIPDGNFLSDSVTDYCQTKFYLKNNQVTAWQYKGNACVAI